MLFKFKSYNQFFNISQTISEELLNEELNEYQKKRVDDMSSMSRHARQDHDAVFGAGNDRVVVPYDDSKDEPIGTHNYIRNVGHSSHTHSILRHLSHHGYNVEDYSTGLASHKDTPNRKIKIMKAIEATGTGDELSGKFSGGRNKKALTWKQTYEADPMRAAGKGEKQLVFSRNRYDVAGVSTDRGWSSCMSMKSSPSADDGGINQHYLPKDLEHGTIAAYLTRKGDDTVKNPIGRISLKRFVNGASAIYRPEGRDYGTMPMGTKGAIQSWAEEKYPSTHGMYIKQPGLYDDDGKTMRIEKGGNFSKEDRHTVEKTFRETIVQANRAGIDAADDRANKDDYEAYDEHKSNMEHLTSKLFHQLPHGEQVHHTIRLLVDHASDHDGDKDDVFDGHESEHSADDYLHNWALHRGHGTNEFSKAMDHIKTMPSHEAFDYHTKINAEIKNTSEPEKHTVLKEYHNALIDNVMKGGSDEHKNAVIHDMMGENEDHKAYYEDLMNDNHGAFDNTHPAHYITNPRTIHSMMLDDDKVNHFPVSKWNDSDLAEHVGKHADEKLANHIMHGELQHHFGTEYSTSNYDRKPYVSKDSVHEDFVKGLNHNPNGEHIQHVLTSQMVLAGGHNPDQKTTLDYRPIVNYEKQTLVEPSELRVGRIETHKQKYSLRHNTHFDSVMADAHDSSDDVEKFATIAQHSKFKSVVDKLRNRHDTQIPAIQNAIKDNEHGLHESVVLKSLRQFLAEAEKENIEQSEKTKQKMKGVAKGSSDNKRQSVGDKMNFNVDPDVVTEPEEKHLLTKTGE